MVVFDDVHDSLVVSCFSLPKVHGPLCSYFALFLTCNLQSKQADPKIAGSCLLVKPPAQPRNVKFVLQQLHSLPCWEVAVTITFWAWEQTFIAHVLCSNLGEAPGHDTIHGLGLGR